MILLSSQTVEFTLNAGEILLITTNNSGTVIYQRTVSAVLVENVTFSTGTKEVGPYDFSGTVNLQCTSGKIEFIVLERILGSYDIQKIKTTYPIKSSWNGGNIVAADDYAALQAAIDAAGTFGRVTMPPVGTFTISTSLVLPEGIIFEGNGANSVIINTNDTVPAFTFASPANGTKQAPFFKNFKVISKNGIKFNSTTGVPPGISGSTQGFIMKGGCYGVFFETSAALGGNGFEASTWFDGSLEKCWFYSAFDKGAWLYGCDLNEIKHNRFQNNRITCIDDESNYTFGTQNFIEHNQFLTMSGSGTQAFVRTSSRHAIINDNYFEQSAILTPIVPAAIRVRTGNNGAKCIALAVEGNRFDMNINNVNYWLRFAAGAVPATLTVAKNVFLDAPIPDMLFADDVTYWYDSLKRRLFYVRDQIQLASDFPFCSSYELIQPPGYAYVFDPSRPGPLTADVGTAMVVKEHAFVINNNSLLHHFDSFQQGGQPSFTATITFIARAENAATTITIQERNSQVGGAAFNYQAISIGTTKAKYTYLTSTAISTNFELLFFNGGANDVLIYSIMVEYG